MTKLEGGLPGPQDRAQPPSLRGMARTPELVEGSGHGAVGARIPPECTGLLVSLAQVAALISYAGMFVTSEAPGPLSLQDWLFAVLPPSVFVVLMILWWKTRAPAHRSATIRAVQRVGLVAGGVGLVGTTLLLPLWLLGSWFDAMMP